MKINFNILAYELIKQGNNFDYFYINYAAEYITEAEAKTIWKNQKQKISKEF